jgi:transposase-like protein
MANQHSRHHPALLAAINLYAERYKAGESLRRLAKEMGVAPMTFRRWLQHQGIATRDVSDAARLTAKGRILPRHTPDRKRCSRCQLTKPASEFPARLREPTLLDHWCRACHAEKAKVRQMRVKASPELRVRSRRLNRNVQLRIKFGITLERYDALHAAQGGVCAICRGAQVGRNSTGGPRELAVDHDHKTGTVRGLLCDRCNVGLGTFGDDPSLLRHAAGYLQSPPGSHH